LAKNTMSDTPRVDAQSGKLGYGVGAASQWADFAREIERELASALRAVTSLAQERDDFRKRLHIEEENRNQLAIFGEALRQIAEGYPSTDGAREIAQKALKP
jgi:hypothetical protein